MQKQKSFQALATEVRIALDCIKTLSYNCGGQDYDTLEQVDNDLKVITATMQRQLPESEGLLVRLQLKLKDSVRQKWNVALRLQVSSVARIVSNRVLTGAKGPGNFLEA